MEDEQTLSIAQLQQVMTRMQAERKLRSGVSWFYWIAGLTVVNSLAMWLGGGMSFLAGLSVTQIVDAVISSLAEELGMPGRGWAMAIALLIDLLIAGVAVVFGLLAMKRHRWSLIVGIVLYGIDALIFLLFGDYLSFGFHLFALWGLVGGLKAMKQLAQLDAAMPVGDGDAVLEMAQLGT